MKIIVGLGNAGKRYVETRHNIGFAVANAFAARHGLSGWRRRFHALVIEAHLADERILLMKPETYVNESGRAVRCAVDWCRVSPSNVMIICDDFNLDLGRLRFRAGGSSGGHNGLKSIIEHLGTEDAQRLRVGIGRDSRVADKDFVLSSFAPEETGAVNEAVARAAEGLDAWLASGIERCQNEYNASTTTQEEEADA